MKKHFSFLSDSKQTYPSDAIAAVRDKNSLLLKNTLGPYFLFGIATMWLVSDNLAVNLPMIHNFSEILAAFIPAIHNLPAATSFAEPARIFMLAMWLTLPISTVRIFRNWAFPPKIFNLERNDQWFLVAAAIFISFLFLMFISYFPDISREEILVGGGRGRWFVRFITGNPFGLAFLGSLVFICASAVLGIASKLTYLVAIRYTPE